MEDKVEKQGLMDHTWQQPQPGFRPALWAATRSQAVLLGHKCSANTTFATSIVLGACLALARRPVSRTPVAYAGRLEMSMLLPAVMQHRATPSARCQGHTASTVRSKGSCALSSCCQPKYNCNYHTNSNQPLLKREMTAQ